jgi:hypothetical protein
MMLATRRRQQNIRYKSDFKKDDLSTTFIMKKQGELLKAFNVHIKKSCPALLQDYDILKLLGESTRGVVGLPVYAQNLKTGRKRGLKFTLYSGDIDYNTSKPYSPHYLEYIIMKYLTYLVKLNVTPHVIQAYGFYHCDKHNFLNILRNKMTVIKNQMQKSDKNQQTNLSKLHNTMEKTYEDFQYIVSKNNMQGEKNINYKVKNELSLTEMEWIDGKPLTDYLHTNLFDNTILEKEKNRLPVLTEFFTILFETIYSLTVIYKTYDNFQHNDLHKNNIMFNSSGQIKTYKYTLNGQTYEISYRGGGVKIFDFDKSNINGLKNQRIETSSRLKYNIYGIRDKNYDTSLLIHGLYRTIFKKYIDVFKYIMELCGGDTSLLMIYPVSGFSKIKNEKKSEIANMLKAEVIKQYNLNEPSIFIKYALLFGNLSKDLTMKNISDIVNLIKGKLSFKLESTIKPLINILNTLREMIYILNRSWDSISAFFIYMTFIGFRDFVKDTYLIKLRRANGHQQNVKYSCMEEVTKLSQQFNMYVKKSESLQISGFDKTILNLLQTNKIISTLTQPSLVYMTQNSQTGVHSFMFNNSKYFNELFGKFQKIKYGKNIEAYYSDANIKKLQTI